MDFSDFIEDMLEDYAEGVDTELDWLDELDEEKLLDDDNLESIDLDELGDNLVDSAMDDLIWGGFED
jgi:hypothetical protein